MKLTQKDIARIKQLRDEHGLTYYQLLRGTGLSPAALQWHIALQSTKGKKDA